MLSSSAGIKDYLIKILLPLWRTRGQDPKTGLFFEGLDMESREAGTDAFRLLVQCRQIYVFSHGFLLGAPKENLNAAVLGLEALESAFWDDLEGGWITALDREGRLKDGRKDCYDHAFVLFAMAYLHRAAGGDRPLLLASRTLDLLEDRLADPLLGGFMEGAERDWTLLAEARRQNPHMHLFEAFLALYEACGEDRYLRHAQRIYELFTSRFFDKSHACLGEHFDRNWRRHPTARGDITEPGHHFEWVWLLHQFARITKSQEPLDYADKLFYFGRRKGWDSQHAGAYDRVDRQGQVLKSDKRVWPQTEYLKACAARLEAGLEGPEALREGLALCEERLLDAATGLWKEPFARDWTGPKRIFCPATTVYHVFLGLSEAARVLEKTEKS